MSEHPEFAVPAAARRVGLSHPRYEPDLISYSTRRSLLSPAKNGDPCNSSSQKDDLQMQ